MTQNRGNRIGDVFPLRMTQEQRAELLSLKQRTAGPQGFGPWLIWAALGAGNTGARDRLGNTPTSPRQGITGARVLPARGPRAGNTQPGSVLPKPIVLDLCGGTGAWSRPYVDAGYDVRLVTLPDADVRCYQPPENVHGVLAAPPCTEFSIAKCGERDFASALEPVVACLRIIALCRPAWWAVENPGRSLIARWLGPARDSWEPFEFGDPWTKRTAIWGDFAIPRRGPYVHATASAMDRSRPEQRAVTPPGFARAFFESNP